MANYNFITGGGVKKDDELTIYPHWAWLQHSGDTIILHLPTGNEFINMGVDVVQFDGVTNNSTDTAVLTPLIKAVFRKATTTGGGDGGVTDAPKFALDGEQFEQNGTTETTYNGETYQVPVYRLKQTFIDTFY